MTLEQLKFLSRTRVEGKCRVWQGTTTTAGYGCFRFRGRYDKAHRVSYVLHKGEIPPGCAVLHKCDRPSCVEPSHLFWGTNLDNSRDMVRKGRSLVGSKNPSAKLDWARVRRIRLLRKQGRSQHSLAREFGISQPQVRRIERGVCWA